MNFNRGKYVLDSDRNFFGNSTSDAYSEHILDSEEPGLG